MNRLTRGILTAVIAVSLVFGMASCGGGNSPKALAKQGMEIMEEYQKLISTNPDPAAIEAWMKKSEELKAKVEKLSEKDSAAYMAELEKLAKAAEK